METKTGKFSIAPDKIVDGELEIAGPQSSLVLRDGETFYFDDSSNLWVTGSLYDQTRITLIQCVQTGSTSHATPGEGVKSHSVTLFPHFIAQGRVHLERDKPTVREIAFTFEDAPSLFYDFDAFGSVANAAQYIDMLTAGNAERFKRPIRTGPDAQIAYFAGQRLIIEADTEIGKIRVEHYPSWAICGPRGIKIANEIWISIIPGLPIGFDDAVNRLRSLLRFVAVSVGRKQNLPDFKLDIGSSDAPKVLQVHWSDYPRRIDDVIPRIRSTPQPADLPLNPIRHPHEFVRVIKSWLAANTERLIARERIHESLAHQNHYTVDRLVGAANAFDQLPEAAVPRRVDLTPEVLSAKQQCKKIFRDLPASDEREFLFRALGRLGKASLNQKVRHRAQIITAAVADKFPSLDFVCDRAIECRNYFVHGSSFRFQLEHPSGNQSFLTDTLEFVFTASELIEAGWDIKRFLDAPTSMSHPFGTYRVRYKESLQALQASAETPTATANDTQDP
jgi:hypothetical protein